MNGNTAGSHMGSAVLPFCVAARRLRGDGKPWVIVGMPTHVVGAAGALPGWRGFVTSQSSTPNYVELCSHRDKRPGEKDNWGRALTKIRGSTRIPKITQLGKNGPLGRPLGSRVGFCRVDELCQLGNGGVLEIGQCFLQLR